MKFKEYYNMLESDSNVAVISVDIQPSYISHCKFIMNDYVKFLNEHRGEIIIFWNGEELGMESQYDMYEFLLNWGVEEDTLERIIWKEKTYAFFRSWMDSGMSRGNLIRAIRHMVTTRNNDSRDVSEEEWKTIYGDDWEDVEHIVTSDSINLPDISISELKKYSGCYLCGGGEQECLAEFRLLMDAFNIRYKIMRNLVY